MDSKRLKQAFKKAFTITTAVFSASVVLLAVLSALFGELVYPESILRLFAVFFMLYLSGYILPDPDGLQTSLIYLSTSCSRHFISAAECWVFLQTTAISNHLTFWS